MSSIFLTSLEKWEAVYLYFLGMGSKVVKFPFDLKINPGHGFFFLLLFYITCSLILLLLFLMPLIFSFSSQLIVNYPILMKLDTYVC